MPAFDASTAVFTRPLNFKPMVGDGATLDTCTEYVVAAYQFATSAKPENLQPAKIVVPGGSAPLKKLVGGFVVPGGSSPLDKVAGGFRGDPSPYAERHKVMLQDVLRTVEYASERGIAVAIRSGGHSFGGYSSTAGDNIQLDMQNFNSITWADDGETITCGTATHVEHVDKALEAGIGAKTGGFVPHGQCGTVCVGGHLTTCGYSVFMPRSFGLMIDHVVAMTLVIAPKTKGGKASVVNLEKPDPDMPESADQRQNDELWYAVVGGGTGSFGVVIDVTLKPLWSGDYPHSRVCNTVMVYTPEKYQKVIDYLAGLAADDDLAADFNGSCALMGTNTANLRPWNPLAILGNAIGVESNENHNIDVLMMEKAPEKYGEAMPAAPNMMLFSTCWANLKGDKEPFDECAAAKKFFADQDTLLHEACSLGDRVAQAGLQFLSFAGVTKGFLGQCAHELKIVDWHEHTTLSKGNNLTTHTPRTHPVPFVAASHVITNDCRNIEGVALDAGGPLLNGPTFLTKLQDAAANEPHVYPDVEFVIYGGRHSMIRSHNCGNPMTAAAWRDTISAFQLYNVYYDNVVEGHNSDVPRKAALANVAELNAKVERLFGADQRWTAFPSTPTAEGENENLDEQHRFYYTDEASYKRMCATKDAYDPRDVFSSNKFGLYATSPTRT